MSTLAVHQNMLANGLAPTKEINAVNECWILVREEKENHRYLYKKQVSSAATIGHDQQTKKHINSPRV